MNSEMEKAKVFNVLFLCSGNSARSIMAEAILNRHGQGRFHAFSGGSDPKGEINPYALAALHKAGFAADGLRSKSWDEFSGPEAPALDFVFTLCDSMAGDTCPHWPGQPMTVHWGLPDPAAVESTEALKHLAFADAFRMLNNRIGIFAALPLSSLDWLSLQNRLDRIGTSAARSAAA
ncbi:MAG: arsenate reductase ArsC [Methylovirgula sp.]